MSLLASLLGMAALVMFVALIVFVIFGQITVRKLRNNPETRDELGLEFASGWDILNAAGALALPRRLNRLLRSTPLSFFYANADLLDKHTNLFDRLLATLFYILWTTSGTAIIALVILEFFGVFEGTLS